MKRLKILLLAPLVAMLAACAFTPEKVALNPTVAVHKSHIGQHKKVMVRIIDARPATQLGGRASTYGPAASITLASNIKKVVRKLVYRNLRANDFVPVAQGASRQLTIRITALQYQQRTGLWAGHIDVSASMELVARNKNRSADKVFRAMKSHAVEFTPTSASDSQQINYVFSSVMNKMFADKSWLRMLAKR